MDYRTMTRMDRVEWLSLFAIAVGVLIWIPPLLNSLRISRINDAYDVREILDVRQVAISDVMAGDRVIMDVDRTIHTPFSGSYIVEVRTYPQRTVVCIAGDTLRYDPAATLPDVITLHWWANSGECDGRDLPAGKYVIITSWTVTNDIPEVSARTIVIESNPFQVRLVTPLAASAAIEKQQDIEQQLEALGQAVRGLQRRSD